MARRRAEEVVGTGREGTGIIKEGGKEWWWGLKEEGSG